MSGRYRTDLWNTHISNCQFAQLWGTIYIWIILWLTLPELFDTVTLQRLFQYLFWLKWKIDDFWNHSRLLKLPVTSRVRGNTLPMIRTTCSLEESSLLPNWMWRIHNLDFPPSPYIWRKWRLRAKWPILAHITIKKQSQGWTSSSPLPCSEST